MMRSMRCLGLVFIQLQIKYNYMDYYSERVICRAYFYRTITIFRSKYSILPHNSSSKIMTEVISSCNKLSQSVISRLFILSLTVVVQI